MSDMLECKITVRQPEAKPLQYGNGEPELILYFNKESKHYEFYPTDNSSDSNNLGK